MIRTYITPSEAEKLFNISRETLRKYYREKKIKLRQTSLSGRKVRYCKEELENLFQSA